MASAAWDVRVLWRNQAVTEHHTCMLASSSSVKAGQFLDWAGSLGQGRWHTTRQPALSMDSSLRAEGSTCSARRVDLRSCGGCERGALTAGWTPLSEDMWQLSGWPHSCLLLARPLLAGTESADDLVPDTVVHENHMLAITASSHLIQIAHQRQL